MSVRERPAGESTIDGAATGLVRFRQDEDEDAVRRAKFSGDRTREHQALA
jgi:hypothetical protein